jgi:hypothetical protein
MFLDQSLIICQDLTNAMKELQRKYEESQLKILQLRDINTNYTSEIKIQKRINSKLKKEMEVVSEKAKFMEEGLEKERAKTEQVKMKFDFKFLTIIRCLLIANH